MLYQLLTYLRLTVFLAPLFLISYQSCTPSTETEDGIIINIEEGLGNVRFANLSEFADSVSYIPLETKVGLELSFIKRLASRDTIFFATDGRTCILFTSAGKVLRKIGLKGRGPGEYNIADQIDITSSKILLIRDIFKLMEFDIQGEFLQSLDIFRAPPGSGAFGRWITLNDSLLFVNVRNDSGEEMHKAQVMDMNGRIIKNYPNYIYFKPDKSGIFSFSAISSIDRYSGKVSFKEAVNDTLFYLGNDLTLRPGFVFHMGKYKTGYMDLLNRTASSPDFAYTQEVFETDRSLFVILKGTCDSFRRDTPIVAAVAGQGGQVFEYEVWYYHKGGILLMVVDKTTGKSFLNDISRSEESIFKSGFINDLDGGPRFLPRFRLDENRLVMPVEAHELKQYIKSDEFREASVLHPEKKKELEELANSLSESDNPVLMVVTMK